MMHNPINWPRYREDREWLIARIRRIPVELTPEQIGEQHAIDDGHAARVFMRLDHHPLIDGEHYGLEPVIDEAEQFTAPDGAQPKEENGST